MVPCSFTIHKPQGKTLYLSIIYIVNSDKRSRIDLVALYQVPELDHLLLNPFTLETFI